MVHLGVMKRLVEYSVHLRVCLDLEAFLACLDHQRTLLGLLEASADYWK
jgi:hypothetical protein